MLAALRDALPVAGTLLAYEAGVRVQRRLSRAAAFNPVLVALVLVATALVVTGTSALDYTEAVRPLTMLLGPATVALALPLYRNLTRIREALVPVLVAVVAGAAVASASAVSVAAALGGSDVLLRSIATKSATAAIAMPVAKEIGGDPSLAAGLAIMTGIIGAVTCTWVFRLAGVRDPRARGLATGVAAHGIGTARILQFAGRPVPSRGWLWASQGLLPDSSCRS
jgi:putative effector of murein hydrolase